MIKKSGFSSFGFFYAYFCVSMKKTVFIFVFVTMFNFLPVFAGAQCSVCTRTTEQLGEKPAGKINAGILYLAATPLAIAGLIGYRWWRKNNS